MRNDSDPDLAKPEYENSLSAMVMCFLGKFEQAVTVAPVDNSNRMLPLSNDSAEALGCIMLFQWRTRSSENLAMDLVSLRVPIFNRI